MFLICGNGCNCSHDRHDPRDVTCVARGDRQTFLGRTWEVTVATQVWEKKHSRAAHDGETVAISVDRPETQQEPAPPARRAGQLTGSCSPRREASNAEVFIKFAGQLAFPG